jgi:PIN like domain
VKICADENVSHRLVGILNELSPGTPRLLHVTDIGAQGVKDRIWVRILAEQDGDAIVSADARMSKRHEELIAIGETGLKLVILPTQYQQGGILLQTAYMLLLWPQIIALVERAAKGCYIKLPAVTLPRSPSWEKIDVQDARKRLRKATRPGRQDQSGESSGPAE